MLKVRSKESMHEIGAEPRYSISAIYPQTATLYDNQAGKEIRSLDAEYALDSEILALFEECAILNAKHEDDLLYQNSIKQLTLPSTSTDMKAIRYINQGDIWQYENDRHLIMQVKDNIMVITQNYSTGKQQSVFLDFLLATGKQLQKGNGKNLLQYFDWSLKA